eukprot:13562555-Ditylum_brightwellii.AAC.1
MLLELWKRIDSRWALLPFGILQDAVIKSNLTSFSQNPCWTFGEDAGEREGNSMWIQALVHKGKDGQLHIVPIPMNSHAYFCATNGLLCASCQFSKGTCTGTGAMHSQEAEPDVLHTNNLVSGQKDCCEVVRKEPTGVSSVRVHNQNSVKNHTVGTVVHSTCLMLLYVAIYWPTVSDLMLWPFALHYDVQWGARHGNWDVAIGQIWWDGVRSLQSSDIACLGMSCFCIKPYLVGQKEVAKIESA